MFACREVVSPRIQVQVRYSESVTGIKLVDQVDARAPSVAAGSIPASSGTL